MREICGIWAGVFLSLLLVSSAVAKMAPPEELKSVFMNMLRLEDSLEEKNWEEVTPMVKDFSVRLSSVTEKISADLGSDLWCDPKERFQKVRDGVEARDFDAAYRGQILFQICLFGIMESYDYKFHPSLLALNKYLDEAIEGCEKRKPDVVKHEMEEIRETYAKARPSLLNGKVPAEIISQFESGIDNVLASLANQDYTASHSALWDMKKALNSMLQLLNM